MDDSIYTSTHVYLFMTSMFETCVYVKPVVDRHRDIYLETSPLVSVVLLVHVSRIYETCVKLQVDRHRDMYLKYES